MLSILPNAPSRKVQERPGNPGVAPFEFAANAYGFLGSSGSCAGGGGTAAFRISSKWQIIADVNGCKMNALEKNLTGDSLTYMVGTRWTPSGTHRLVPYLQTLAGGIKITQELIFPQQEAGLDAVAKSTGSPPPDHSKYTEQFEHSGFALAMGTGLDLHFNRALGFRLIGLEYLHSWTEGLPGFTHPNGFQVKAGVILRMGTW